jgi:hypothetical protein
MKKFLFAFWLTLTKFGWGIAVVFLIYGGEHEVVGRVLKNTEIVAGIALYLSALVAILYFPFRVPEVQYEAISRVFLPHTAAVIPVFWFLCAVFLNSARIFGHLEDQENGQLLFYCGVALALLLTVSELCWFREKRRQLHRAGLLLQVEGY